MAKNKLRRFTDMAGYSNVVEVPFDEVFSRDFRLKGCWNRDHFQKEQPVVLELGCGKGEYTVALARKYPDKNFIGVDIKGARMWVGATAARSEGLSNVAFLRTRIDFIGSCFGPGEVSEIWITFPDPQPRSPRISKRLTSSRFLQQYRGFLKPEGTVHLKTDSMLLFQYTKLLLEYNQLDISQSIDDLYHCGAADEILSIKTHYEQLFLSRGETIKYLQFRLEREGALQELPRELIDSING